MPPLPDSSPFLSTDDPVTWRELLTIVAMTPVLLVKLLVAVLACCALSCVTAISPSDTSTFESCVYPPFYVLQAMFGYFRVPVFGRKHHRDLLQAIDGGEGGVVVYNHVSFLDWLLLINVGPFGFVALRKYIYPPFSDCMERCGSMLITPGDGVTHALVARCKAPGQTYPLAVAPEGVTTNGKALVRFRSGAFVAKAPVLPILLRYRYDVVNPAWTQRHPLWTAVRLLSRCRNHATVEVLPLMRSLGPDESPTDYARRVRAAMATALGVETSEMGRDDALAAQRVTR